MYIKTMTNHEEWLARITVRIAAPLLIGAVLGKTETESMENLRKDCPNLFGQELIDTVIDEWHKILKESGEWQRQSKPPLR
jgi:hypothetical protein